MCRKMMMMVVCLMVLLLPCRAQTFAEWWSQKSTQKKYLVQQIAKLQLYLGYVKKGYSIADKGLTTIGQIKNGDFNMHSLFFDDLRIVHPAVKNYSKTEAILADIPAIRDKAKDLRELLSSSSWFSDGENVFIGKQIDNMLEQLLGDITRLNDVLSDHSLQMNDNDRLDRIDKIYKSVAEKKEWINRHGAYCSLLTIQRQKNLADLNTLQEFNKP